GRGEFVVLTSAAEVPITSLEIAVRPAADVPDGVAPKTLYLVSNDSAYLVTLPEDGWKRPKSRYAVKFPHELRTSCLTEVLDEAYAPAGKATARTTLAEVTARTPLDGRSLDDLVAALSRGGVDAEASAALLERGGSAAVAATVNAYDKLDSGGKEMARRVID